MTITFSADLADFTNRHFFYQFMASFFTNLRIILYQSTTWRFTNLRTTSIFLTILWQDFLLPIWPPHVRPVFPGSATAATVVPDRPVTRLSYSVATRSVETDWRRPAEWQHYSGSVSPRPPPPSSVCAAPSSAATGETGDGRKRQRSAR